MPSWRDNKVGIPWAHSTCYASPQLQQQLREERRAVWLPPRVGCFKCANPEWICDRQAASGQCVHEDQVLVLCQALLKARSRNSWAAEVWKASCPPQGTNWGFEEAWRWLAGTGDFLGAPGFNANLLACAIFEHINLSLT